MSTFVFPVPLSIYNHCHSHTTDDYVNFLVEVFKRTTDRVGIKPVPSYLTPEERLVKLQLEDEGMKTAIDNFEFKEDEHWLSMSLRWYEKNGIKVDRSNATIHLDMAQKRLWGLTGNLWMKKFTVPFRLVNKKIDPEVFGFITQDLALVNFFWDNFALNGVKFNHPLFFYIFDMVPDPSMAYYNEFNLNKFVEDMVRCYNQSYKGLIKIE